MPFAGRSVNSLNPESTDENFETAKEAFLAAVEKDIGSIFSQESYRRAENGGILLDAASHLSLTGHAKRSRPWLVYLYGISRHCSDADLVKISVAGEMIHTASLLHDDVIDNASLRRGRQTVNVIHGNTIAVLSGDLLLSEAIYRLRDFEKRVIVEAVDVVRQMSISCAAEYQFRGKTDLSREDWVGIAHGKTAALFGWCAAATMRISGGSEDLVEIAYRSAWELGIAFQIADDLKDFYAEDEVKGKYADLYNQNPNLVVIEALNADPAFRGDLEKFWKLENPARHDLEALGSRLVSGKHTDAVFTELLSRISTAMDLIDRTGDKTLKKNIQSWVFRLYSSMSSNAGDMKTSELEALLQGG